MNFIQEGKSAEQNAERNPEMNIGCDGPKQLVSGAICRLRQSIKPLTQIVDLT
jgi:hypothetical protein